MQLKATQVVERISGFKDKMDIKERTENSYTKGQELQKE
jgi:hypothetical protein